MKDRFAKKLRDQLISDFKQKFTGIEIKIQPYSENQPMMLFIGTPKLEFWYSIGISWSEEENYFAMCPHIEHVSTTRRLRDDEYHYHEWLHDALNRFAIDVKFDLDLKTFQRIHQYVIDHGDISQRPHFDNLWFVNMTIGIDTFAVGETRDQAIAGMASMIASGTYYRLQLFKLWLKE